MTNSIGENYKRKVFVILRTDTNKVEVRTNKKQVFQYLEDLKITLRLGGRIGDALRQQGKDDTVSTYNVFTKRFNINLSSIQFTVNSLFSDFKIIITEHEI